MATVKTTIISEYAGVTVEQVFCNFSQEHPYAFVVSDVNGVIDAFYTEEDAEACAGFQRFVNLEVDELKKEQDAKRTMPALFPVLAMLFLSLFGMRESHAADWSTEDKVSEGIYQTANFLDCLQTVYIARHPDKYMEVQSAPIIGAHPDSATVYGYMAATAVGHAAVTTLLVNMDAPSWLRRSWQSVTLGIKVQDLRKNYNFGIRMSF